MCVCVCFIETALPCYLKVKGSDHSKFFILSFEIISYLFLSSDDHILFMILDFI